MAKTVKVRMINPRGNPSQGGAVLARGGTFQVPEYWAERFIADGDAELVEVKKTEPKKTDPPKSKGKSK